MYLIEYLNTIKIGQQRVNKALFWKGLKSRLLHEDY